MNPRVRRRLEELRAEYEVKPYSELADGAWHDLPPEEIDGCVYEPAVFTEPYQGTLLLVVQLRRKVLLVFKQTDCLGSVIAASGLVRHVDGEFIWNEIGFP